MWFLIGEGSKFEIQVHKEKPVASPLVPGGLEIPIKVSGTWVSLKHFQLERGAKVKEVKYPTTGSMLMTQRIFYKG